MHIVKPIENRVVVVEVITKNVIVAVWDPY